MRRQQTSRLHRTIEKTMLFVFIILIRIGATSASSGGCLLTESSECELVLAQRDTAAMEQQDGSTTLATSTTISAALQATSSTSITLPRPFDENLGNNFTVSSCPSFFDSFLNLPGFQSCLPFSLLLQTSNSFFSISKSLVQITQTMDATCSVDYLSCSSLMSSLASQISQTSNCGQDLQYQNPLVVQAYNGFLAYDVLYQAGCLKDSSGGYCYGDAMTNTTSPSTYYIYYLPLGVQLPNITQASCNQCVQDTMAVFASGATNSSTPLSKDYVAAARIVDSNCGDSFVDSAIQISAACSITTVSALTAVSIISLIYRIID